MSRIIIIVLFLYRQLIPDTALLLDLQATLTGVVVLYATSTNATSTNTSSSSTVQLSLAHINTSTDTAPERVDQNTSAVLEVETDTSTVRQKKSLLQASPHFVVFVVAIVVAVIIVAVIVVVIVVIFVIVVIVVQCSCYYHYCYCCRCWLVTGDRCSFRVGKTTGSSLSDMGSCTRTPTTRRPILRLTPPYTWSPYTRRRLMIRRPISTTG